MDGETVDKRIKRYLKVLKILLVEGKTFSLNLIHRGNDNDK